MSEPGMNEHDGGTESEIQVQVQVTDGVGVLSWSGPADVDSLRRAVELATDDVIIDKGVRRVEVAISAGDELARRALHLAGFRREGVRREVLPTGDGFGDVWIYGRLARDDVYGETAWSSVMDSVLPTKRVIAHVLYRDERDRLIYCETTYKSDWELPGGVVEPGESPQAGARREVAEELGMDLPVGRLLCTDWLPPHLGWGDAVQLVFDGGTLSDAQIEQIRFTDNEIKAVHRVALADLEGHTYPGAVARMTSICTAEESALPLYLEAGLEPR